MGYTYISSRTNQTVVALSKLSDRKARDESGLFISEGAKLCREALGRINVKYALVKGCEDNCERDLIDLAERCGGEVIVLSENAFSKISQDAAPDGIMFVCEKPDTSALPERNERIIMLECVRDPGNVGTVIRSAAAFGFDRVVLCDCADLFAPKTVRATMGALYKTKFTVCRSPDEVLNYMKKDGRRIVAAALGSGGMVLGRCELLENDCPVIGNEGHGVSEKMLAEADKTIMIPMSKKTESLNAAAAAAVILWEYGKTFGAVD